MQALARIQEIQSQAAAITQVLRAPSFDAHLRAASVSTAEPTIAAAAVSTAEPTIAAAAVSTETTAISGQLRTFPLMNRPSGPSNPTPTTLDIPDDVQLPARADRWLGEIEAAANRHGLPPKLLTALVWSESAFNADAVSHAGAIGLAQLMPGTAAMMNLDPHDPEQNLEGGARYLAAQLERFESVDLALAAYNAGPGRVSRAGGIPNITETQNYVEIVTRRYSELGGDDA
jgi:soluble lytic murein transglycosylase-like protein